ncbi:hypothetical protein [Hymenobacter sp. BT559]|uniref:hypothetical protein n=1 Tax=Hymenobacter sp. BT559 TaxID=2795729 RepID=UPI0018EB5360|nr:hypothetical protein [Hymenobacter sp. BT559]MBJ6145547.1 hypothetical protein [Hymenobacter sp. BT559]
MRFFLLATFFAGAGLQAQAQVSLRLGGSQGTPGSYVLRAEPQVRRTGLLKVSAKQLTGKDSDGQKIERRPGEVISLRVGTQRYTTAQGFTVRNGLFEHVENDKVFVELLDSGRVSLLRYTSRLRTGQLGPAGDFTAYLVQQNGQPLAITLYNDTGSYLKNNKDLSAELRPYALNRPDLLQLLDADRVGPTQLTRFFHALNTNSDF